MLPHIILCATICHHTAVERDLGAYVAIAFIYSFRINLFDRLGSDLMVTLHYITEGTKRIGFQFDFCVLGLAFEPRFCHVLSAVFFLIQKGCCRSEGVSHLQRAAFQVRLAEACDDWLVMVVCLQMLLLWLSI